MPDFRMQQNSFPIASVIDAAQRNNVLQEQAREAGNKSLIEGLQSIGQVGQSLYDQKLRVAQALAGAKMYAQTPEGQQMLGTNQVTTGPQGQAVTPNQTAAYNPETGTLTPNQSPVTEQTLATSMFGMSPKDILENIRETRKVGYEGQKIPIEARKAAAEEENNKIQRLIQGLLANATIKNQAQERTQAAENAALDANKETAKHYILHPLDAYAASKAISTAGQIGTSLPAVGQTVTHPSGVKITRNK